MSTLVSSFQKLDPTTQTGSLDEPVGGIRRVFGNDFVWTADLQCLLWTRKWCRGSLVVSKDLQGRRHKQKWTGAWESQSALFCRVRVERCIGAATDSHSADVHSPVKLLVL